jgi:hypothetical protein
MLKNDQTLIFNYAANASFFWNLYRDFQFWTFFLSIFEIPKILLEKISKSTYPIFLKYPFKYIIIQLKELIEFSFYFV